MESRHLFIIIYFAIVIGITVFLAYLLILLVKSLKKYTKSGEVRKQKKIVTKSLGEVLKKHRTESKMTQEFVAESVGVSRQAVSKWENGTSDPSTSNLVALANLFGISPEELLKEMTE